MKCGLSGGRVTCLRSTVRGEGYRCLWRCRDTISTSPHFTGSGGWRHLSPTSSPLCPPLRTSWSPFGLSVCFASCPLSCPGTAAILAEGRRKLPAPTLGPRVLGHV